MGKEERYNVGGADDGLGDSSSGGGSQSAQQTTEDTRQESSTEGDGSEGDKDSLPHRVRYDSPQEAREPLNLHIDSKDEQRLRELTGLAKTEFDEKIYATDVKLAAFRCDITDEDAFLEEMRKIGYGYFD